MAAAVATVPASRRLPAHPLSASASAAAPSLIRLAGSSRRLRRAMRVSAAAEDPDVLPGPGAGDLEMLLEDLPEGALGGSQLDIGGLAFQSDISLITLSYLISQDYSCNLTYYTWRVTKLIPLFYSYSNEKSEARISDGASISTDSKDNSR